MFRGNFFNFLNPTFQAFNFCPPKHTYCHLCWRICNSCSHCRLLRWPRCSWPSRCNAVPCSVWIFRSRGRVCWSCLASGTTVGHSRCHPWTSTCKSCSVTGRWQTARSSRSVDFSLEVTIMCVDYETVSYGI